MRFKIWVENNLENNNELQGIWADTFKALGLGGLSDEDAAQQSLSKINFGSRNANDKNSDIKGKSAVSKRLENGQIFQRLQKINDPEIQKGIEDARRWLDSKDSNMANASTTVGTLLQKLFGKQNFEKFIDGNFPKTDQAKAQVQPQPPKDNTQDPNGSNVQNPAANNQPGTPPQSGMMGQQPQANSVMMPPPPNNPMPPKPAGAEMGMF